MMMMMMKRTKNKKLKGRRKDRKAKKKTTSNPRISYGQRYPRPAYVFYQLHGEKQGRKFLCLRHIN